MYEPLLIYLSGRPVFLSCYRHFLHSQGIQHPPNLYPQFPFFSLGLEFVLNSKSKMRNKSIKINSPRVILPLFLLSVYDDLFRLQKMLLNVDVHVCVSVSVCDIYDICMARM